MQISDLIHLNLNDPLTLTQATIDALKHESKIEKFINQIKDDQSSYANQTPSDRVFRFCETIQNSTYRSRSIIEKPCFYRDSENPAIRGSQFWYRLKHADNSIPELDQIELFAPLRNEDTDDYQDLIIKFKDENQYHVYHSTGTRNDDDIRDFIYIHILNDEGCNYYCLSPQKMMYYFDHYILYQANQRRISPQNQMIELLYNLWSVQFDQKSVTKDQSQQLNQNFPQELMPLLQLIRTTKNRQLTFTILELARFYFEYQQHCLTVNTAHVQKWLMRASYDDDELDDQDIQAINQYNEELMKHPNHQILNQIHPLSADNDEYQALQAQISKTPDKPLQIKQVYKFDTKDDRENYPNHQLVIHGTMNCSIMPIILNGLQTYEEVNANQYVSTQDYAYSGHALGEGVYFTPINNCKRSLAFADRCKDHQAILFVADIGYHHCEDTESYGDIDDDSVDCIYAKHVGSSTFNDEICVRHSNQIKLKYIIVVER